MIFLKQGFKSINSTLFLNFPLVPSGENILKLEDYTDPDNGSVLFEEEFGSGESKDVRLHEALWQCQTVFSTYTGKVSRKTIFLFSNSVSPHDDGKLDVQARRKAADLHNMDIFLDVVPIVPIEQVSPLKS